MKTLFVALAALSVLAVACWFLPMKDMAHQSLEACRALGFPGMLLFVLAYVMLAHGLFPIAPLTMAAGSLYGMAFGYLVAATASLVCAASGYLLGRTYLRTRVERWLRKHPAVQAVQASISENGAAMVLWMRMGTVLPFMIANLAFGFTRVPLGRYLLASWGGMLPGTLLYVYMGVLGGKWLKHGGSLTGIQKGLPFAGISIALCLAWFIGGSARARMKRGPSLRPCARGRTKQGQVPAR